MKHIYTLFLLLGLGFIPLSLNAAEIYTSETVNINTPTESNVYSAGGQIFTSSPIGGDLIAGGGVVDVRSDVAGDLLIGGGQINIMGNVTGDVRVTGGSITISSVVDGDVVVMGGNVILTPNAAIRGDLIAGVGSIIIDGIVEKNARIGAGDLTLNGSINGNAILDIQNFKNPNGSGKILGNLSYSADNSMMSLESITQGEVSFSEGQYPHIEKKRAFWGFITGYVIFKTLSILIFSLLLIFTFPKFFRETGVILAKNPWKSGLSGLIVFALLPVVALLLFITIIGIPVGLFLLVAFGFMLWFCNIVNVSVLSAWIYQKYSIKALYQKLLIVLGFSIFFGITSGIGLIVWFFTMGATITRKMEILKSVR